MGGDGREAGDARAYELSLLYCMDGRVPGTLLDGALARLGATHGEMRREWQRVTDLGPARPGRMYATLEFLKGARVGGSRRTNGSLVVERHRFATWPDFEYEVEYDTEGPGWMLNRAEFVRLSGSMPPDAPPAPWRCLKNEALAGFEVLREIDSWGGYDSYEVRDADGARLFLSFSHGLLLEVAPLESLPGQPADHGHRVARPGPRGDE